MKNELKHTAHSTYRCEYHIVFAPKYRRKEIYGAIKKDIGEILRKLCNEKKVEIIEAELCPDHVHMLVTIPPYISIAQFVGFIKGKSSLMIFDRHANLKYKYGSRNFWCRGYYVDTVGKNARIIEEYIKNQLEEDYSMDITSFLKKGKNSMAVLVWHYGTDSQRYIKAKAGLIFELQSSENVLLASGEHTRARCSVAYKQGAEKLVARQLGFSFAYDATKEDDWKTTGKGLQSSVLVDKNCSFVERPIEKLKLLECVHGRVVLAENNHYIIDLGKETVGLVSLDFVSPAVQKIVVAWGEDLQDGHKIE